MNELMIEQMIWSMVDPLARRESKLTCDSWVLTWTVENPRLVYKRLGILHHTQTRHPSVTHYSRLRREEFTHLLSP